jgi:hypothetical protein
VHEGKESEERQSVLVPQFEIVLQLEDCLREEEVSDDLKAEEEKHLREWFRKARQERYKVCWKCTGILHSG